MGQALIITPVRPGEAPALNRCLAELPRDVVPDGPGEPRAVPVSPFTGQLPPTHFARLVVIELHGAPHLLFSSRFDGPIDDYLRALAATPQALRIWSHWPIFSGDGDALDHGHWSATSATLGITCPASMWSVPSRWR